MKIVLAIWISSLLTFIATSAYVLSGGDLKAPGELGENFAAVGITLAGLLLVVTVISFLIMFKNTKKREVMERGSMRKPEMVR